MRNIRLKKIKEKIRDKFPDNKTLRNFVRKIVLNKYLKVNIDKNEIIAAEENYEKKLELIKSSSLKWPKFYEYVDLQYNKVIERDPKLKNLNDIEKKKINEDMKFCIYAYGITPTEYSVYDFYNKDYEYRSSYVSEKDHMSFVHIMNDLFEMQIFNDKMKTYEKFSKYYNREIISIEQPSDYDKFIDYVEAHPIFVKKQVYESMGNSVEKINIKDYDKKDLFNKFISKGKTILEECITQSAQLEKLNKSSVNTVRIITFELKDRVVPAYSFMKIGREGSFVDNGGAGGIFVGIDISNGTFNTNGIDEDNNVYSNHPENNIKFIGYELPEWDKLLSLSKEISSNNKGIKYIGWDFAHDSERGWVIVEGNAMSQFIGPQSVSKKGIRKQVVDYMKKMNIDDKLINFL